MDRDFINNLKTLNLNKTNFNGILPDDSLKLYKKVLHLSKEKSSDKLILLNLYETATHYGAGNELGYIRHQDFTYNPPISRIIEIMEKEGGVPVGEELFVFACIYSVLRHRGSCTFIVDSEILNFKTTLKTYKLDSIDKYFKEDKSIENIENIIKVQEAGFLDFIRHAHMEWGSQISAIPNNKVEKLVEACNDFLKFSTGAYDPKIRLWQSRAAKLLK